MNKRSLFRALGAAVLALGFGLPVHAQDKTAIKVGVTAGPQAQVMEAVKKIAVKQGLNIQIVEFSDYVQPNAALASGDLDANSYQHQPYLDQQIKDRGYKFAVVGQSINMPMGIYSRKFKRLDDLGNRARFGMPNDPTNGGRALLLLQEKGLIKLKPSTGLKATPLDVAENPKRLRFVELDAAQLPRSLDDLDAAAVNTNFALSAGLNPSRDAIALESAQSPYINILAVREADKDQPWVARFVQAYHSPEVRQFIQQQFKGSVLPAW
jgi:D-methionine transport system substrate-binding protein